MNYTELQNAILDWLMRPDLTDAVPHFIASAEARLNRDTRLGAPAVLVDFPVDADGEALPSDLRTIDSWWLAGPTWYGAMEVVNGSQLGRLKQKHTSGPPRYAALIGGAAYFAPEPAEETNTLLSYFRKIPALSDGEPTNWFLDEHPDIYRLAALAESAPYLKDDARLPMWESQLDARLNDLARANEAATYAGTLTKRLNPIG